MNDGSLRSKIRLIAPRKRGIIVAAIMLCVACALCAATVRLHQTAGSRRVVGALRNLDADLSVYPGDSFPMEQMTIMVKNALSDPDDEGLTVHLEWDGEFDKSSDTLHVKCDRMTIALDGSELMRVRGTANLTAPGAQRPRGCPPGPGLTVVR